MGEHMPRLHRIANWECTLFLAAHKELSNALDVLDQDVGDVRVPLVVVDADGIAASLDPGGGVVLVDDLRSDIRSRS